MKQLLIAAAVSVTLASIPAIGFSSSSIPDDANKLASSCPQDVKHIWTQGTEVVIAVQGQHSGEGPSATFGVKGGDPACITCDGSTHVVLPGNFWICKSDEPISFADSKPQYGPDNGARGYWYGPVG